MDYSTWNKDMAARDCLFRALHPNDWAFHHWRASGDASAIAVLRDMRKDEGAKAASEIGINPLIAMDLAERGALLETLHETCKSLVGLIGDESLLGSIAVSLMVAINHDDNGGGVSI